jgi:diguanylate cyclase (GGDEF)-like protein
MKWRHALLATLALSLWTAFLVFMARRETGLAEERLRDIALSQARALYNQVVDVREWNASHGGVYVPVTEATPPNPWLEVPGRDVTTESGLRLTLMNPAYMTRQFAEITRRRRGIVLHLTSATPLRPGNAPAPWERAALDSFARGATEHAEFAVDADGREIHRYMAPLPVEESCLRCHAKQGYTVGQVRGGISVVTPAGLLGRSRASFRRSVLLASLVLWGLGAGLIAAVAAAYHQKTLLVARLRELALVDELTGLHNRRAFLVLAGKQLQIARRTGRTDVLLFIDLDGMKRINDEQGHEAGDAALRRTAEVLRAAFRTSDIIARFGGDEFVVLCPDTTPPAVPTLVAGLQRQVGDANAGAAVPWRLALSVGIATIDPQQSATLDEVIRSADAAMYREKRQKGTARP